MKKILFTLFICQVLLFSTISVNGQEVRIYSENNYQSLYATLKPGQSVNFTPDGCSGSFSVINAAVKIELLNPPFPFPFMFLYSEKNIQNIEPGTDQYCGKTLKISCLNKAESVNELPQPTSWLPVDRNNINDDRAPIEMKIGHKVLMLRRAFLWENSEDLGCCAGPYASVGLWLYNSNLLTDYNFNFDAIANDYCGKDDPGESYGFSSCDPKICSTFASKYPVLSYGFKMPGTIYKADNPCNDFGSGCSFFGIGPEDPRSEWIDGLWGLCYSRIPIFEWATNTPEKISLVLREGDDTNCDDFLGGMLISKNDTGNKILFKAWKFGWVELEIITIKQDDLVENVAKGNQYWYANWSGANPEEIHSISQTPPYDQFVPLAGKTIPEMESIFFNNTKVGLLGGKFPSGKLSKPMMYKIGCECQPAVLGSLSGARLFKDRDYKGDMRIFTSDVSDLTKSNIQFNDFISSVQLIDIKEIRLYRDIDYNGGYISITKDTPNLNDEWNDKVSSIKIIQ